jgi:type IV pilus assembly protein PilV
VTMNDTLPNVHGERGATLLEVLITIVILAFGLLGLVGLEAKMQTSEVESYQRAQALLLLNDMVDRMNAQLGSANALAAPGDVPAVDGYASSTEVYGTGHSDPSPCPTAQGAARDQCEWSMALKGAAETKSGANLGAMIGARGCIVQLQAPNTNTGVCTPGIYLVSVAWQGLNMTAAPAAGATCGQNSYGDEKYRRIVSARVVIGLPSCS